MDIAASANARAHKAGFLSKNFIEEGLDCCIDIVQTYGYVEATSDSIRKEIKTDSNNAILVPGCQIRGFVKLRATACANLLVETEMRASVLLSGKNPGHKKGVKLLSEARVLESYLRRRKRCLNYIVNIERDDDANDTLANIKGFLSPDRQQPLSTTKVNDLFIVSSSFHLIALAKATEEILNQTNFKIGRVVLVGAEDPDTAFSKISPIARSRYIKNLSFYIMKYLLLDDKKSAHTAYY